MASNGGYGRDEVEKKVLHCKKPKGGGGMAKGEAEGEVIGGPPQPGTEKDISTDKASARGQTKGVRGNLD